jgi:hypothetical protein
VLALAITLPLLACDQNMSEQPKDKSYGESTVFDNGQVQQAPVPGSVARDAPAREAALMDRPPLTATLLARGRERFDIFCAPCHSQVGDGDGIIVAHGMPHPPSFHDARLRAAPDEHFLDVIARGYGAMYSYAARVPPADRWAIVAYIRALQVSQYAAVADLPPADRARLPPRPQ